MRTLALPPFWSLVEAHGDELLVHARRLAGDANGEDVAAGGAAARAARVPAPPPRRAPPRVALPHHHDDRHGPPPRAAPARCSPTTRPAAAAEPDHYDDAFESLIAALPDSAQSALRLRFVDDLDYAGVARALGISPEAARQRVSTAIRALRAQGAAA